jgi:ribonuclease HI
MPCNVGWWFSPGNVVQRREKVVRSVYHRRPLGTEAAFAHHCPTDSSRSRHLLITLFTDASHCPKTHVAAYAAWAKADGRTVRRAGVLKERVRDSSLAEAQALVNGLCFVLASLKPAPTSKIIAQTDCLTAIEALTGQLRNRKTVARFAPVNEVYQSRIIAAGITVEFRHVAAHKGVATPRNAVNTWCDNTCRELMRAARGNGAPAETSVAG